MIRPADAAGLAEAALRLRAGGLVAMPTETVYGLAADAFQARACAAVFEAKGRPAFDPLIVHVAQRDWLPRVCKGVTPAAERLAQAFWPGPLTLVLPRLDSIPGIVTSGLDSVAVRLPANPVALALLRLCDTPLAAPSANRFGRLSPTRPEHVEASLGAEVLVLDGGPCAVGVESSIVDARGARPRLLRPGGIPQEDLERVLGQALEAAPAEGERPLGPGQLPSHYAPATPLRLLAGPAGPGSGRAGRALLAFREAPPRHAYGAVEVLSAQGDAVEAAARLFECLHRLDARALSGIDAEPAPEAGLGRAINDRLRRAAAAGR